MGGLRFDPGQTNDDLLQALERAAEAIWLINQEPFAPGDLEP